MIHVEPESHARALLREWLRQQYGDDWYGWSDERLSHVKAAYLAGYADAHTEMRQEHANGT